MIAWLKWILFDRSAFVGLVRGLVTAAGALTISGDVPVVLKPYLPPWAGALLIVAGLFLRAGQMNPPKENAP